MIEQNDFNEETERREFCLLIARVAAEVWHDLDKIRGSNAQIAQAFDEEAITARLVRDIASRFSATSKIVTNLRQFTKAEEAKRGADWEFVFKSGDHYTLWRFQAKRIHYIDGRPAYRFDDKSRIKPTEQPARLIAFSQIDRATPMYMFYNFFTEEMKEFGVECHTDTSLPMSAFGISICHASAVLGHLDRPSKRYLFLDEVDSIAGDSCAMECLFCRRRDESLMDTIDPNLAEFFNPKILNYYHACGFAPSMTLNSAPSHVARAIASLEMGPFEQAEVLPAEFGSVRGLVLLDAKSALNEPPL